MKNQLKKSLSFLMAVLMILSCWVWVAPDKAEAADGTYTLTIVYDTVNTAENGGYCAVWYYPTNADGTLDKREMKPVSIDNTEFESLFSEADGSYGVKKTLYNIPGWPCQIHWYVNAKGANNYEVGIKQVIINGVTVATCNQTFVDDLGAFSYDNNRDFCWNFNGTGGSEGYLASRTWYEPDFKSLTEMKSTDVDVPAYSSDANAPTSATSTVTVTAGLDQYGVEYKAKKPESVYTHKLKYYNAIGDLKDLDSSYATVTSGNKNPATVQVNSLIQELFAGEAFIEIYLESYYSKDVTSVALTPIKLKFPTYSASFYPNGGTIGRSATNNTNSDDNPIVYSGYLFSSYIEKTPPFAERSKDGMELAGYYSEKNTPSLGLEDNFPNGVRFDIENTQVGAGGDSHWYAAWRAKTYKAEFVVGTNLLGTLDAKHGRAMVEGTDMYESVAEINDKLASAYETAGKTAISFVNTNNFGRAPTLNGKTFVGWRLQTSEGTLDDIYNVNITGNVRFEAIFESPEVAEKEYTLTFYDGTGLKEANEAKKETVKFRSRVEAPDGLTMDADEVYSYEFIGWAKNIGKNYYAVDAEGKDENGAYITYQDKDTAEFIAVEDASYVPVFRMTKVPYAVTFSFRQNVGEAYTTQNITVNDYHYGDNVTVPEGVKDNYTYNGKRYTITGWKQGAASVDLDKVTVTKDMTLTAVYDGGNDAVYTINFYGKDVDGETDVLLNEGSNQYSDKDKVTVPDVPMYINTEDALYVFTGWSPEVNQEAKVDVDYKATYEKKVYADLSFYNGETEIYSISGEGEDEASSLFVGDVIPEYDETYGAPVKDADAVGSYDWIGWKDQAGNEVIPGTTVLTGDTKLYAEYETTKNKYNVEFVIPGAEGEPDVVVLKNEYEYKQAIATPANPESYKDDLYNYTFKGWSPEVSPLCYGDVTYTATYKRTPIYYNINWLNEVNAPYRVSKVAFDKKIQLIAAPDPTSFGPAEEGYSWAFKEWVRCNEYGDALDKNGNVVENEADAYKLDRGTVMFVKEALYFYPTYEQVPGKYTVKFHDANGAYMGSLQLSHNETIDTYTADFAEILFEEARLADLYEAEDIDASEYHFIFDKWVVMGENGATTELESNENGDHIITGAVSVKAVLRAQAHNLVKGEMIKEPTCLETGYAEICCDYEYCNLEDDYVIIDKIRDENAPSGRVYIGSDSWTTEQFAPVNTVDYVTKIYVGANDATIITAKDNGTWSMENRFLEHSRGVGKIDFAVVNVKDIDDFATFNPREDISVWNNIYDHKVIENQVLAEVLAERNINMDDYMMMLPNDSKKLSVQAEVKAVLATYNANATGILGDLGLENGNEYVIYLRLSDVQDMSDNTVNISYLSTGRLHYGTQAATITVRGDGYGAKFCEEATIEVKDDTDGFEIYIDGVKQNISATTTSAAGTCSAKFTNNTTGVHTLTVVDKNGNKSTKTFEIKGGHSYRNYTVAATCGNAGSNYNLCTVCGVRETVKVDPARGHSFKDNFTVIAPTCVVNGSRVYVCDNNCGTKLTVGPASTAEELAQALIYDETTAAYRALTADDLKDLIATGEHTYAKVADEEGKDTDVDAWVIDKAATCSADGAKHRDCIKCGYRQSVEIKADGVSHKFYRARIEKGDEPTCTEKGIKSQTCRYCGIKETVEEIAALGHIAGEYRTVTAATCTAAGSKILTCGRCSTAETPVDIGEPVEAEDGTVTFDGKEVEIPALDHAWKTDGDPYKKTVGEGEEPDDNWYQDYVCANDATHTKTEVTEYEEKQEATVTFMNGTEAVATVTKYVGESVSAVDVTVVPTKAADATYKYTFSHWADAEGKEVKLPVTVAEGGATYYAVFAEKNVKYTITYLNEDGSQYDKVGYLNNKAVVDLVDGPAKAETAYKTFTFAGWAEKVEKTVTEDIVDEEGNTTTIEKDVIEYVLVGDTVTIDGENVVLYARYTSKDRFYTVTYAMTMSDTIESISVRAGAKVRACAITPEKDGDSKYHYQFAGWNKANQLKAEITSNIYTTPNFTPVAHELTVDVVTPASCTANRVEKKVCACGYETEAAEVKNSALSHNWSETSDYDATTGKNIRKCQNVGCTATTTDTRTFSFNFFFEEPADANVKPDRDINNISWGTKVDASRLPADPTKNADDQYIYTFKGWKLKGDTDDKLQKIEDIVVKQDCDFVAVYDKVVREYKVTFAYEHSHKAIKTYTVKYGEGITFDGATPEKSKDTDPNYNADIYHYTFKGWSASTAEITKDITVYAKFERAEHTFGPKVEIEEANCQQGAGYTQTCTVATCKYVKETTGDPLDHVFELNDKGELQCTYIINGERCSEIKSVEDDGDDNETPVAEVKVIVTVDRDGAPARSIKVITQALGEDATKDASTNANGVATIVVESGKTYVAWVEIDGQKIEVPLATDSEGNFIGIYSIVTNNNSGDSDDDCGCACHRNNFWGTIFRFFHKIIKLITGEFKCCGNPDPMYG